VKEQEGLIRDFGLLKATALNMSNMVGIGPFMTIHLIIGAMGGPQAMLGWMVGVVLAACDGMVWSELSAAMPGSGGTTVYLRECFGRERWGRLMAFLFIWQFILSGPLEIASGAIGVSGYIGFHFMKRPWWHEHYFKVLGVAIAFVAMLLLYRRITAIGRLMVGLWLVMLCTVFFIIGSALFHFDVSKILPFPPNAFHVDRHFLFGLGAAMGLAMYDYLGYYDVCYIGDEVKNPERTIPRSVLISVAAVAAIYMTMNISFIGVLPWQDVIGMHTSNDVGTVGIEFVSRLYGENAAIAFTVLIVITGFASVFALILGYSRIPYAAARDGVFLQWFNHLHPIQKFPDRSLLVIGAVTMAASLFSLQEVISAILTCRILVQFLGQNAGLVLYRRRTGRPLPFRMWLYPIPCGIAFLGWAFIFATSGWPFKLAGMSVLVSGFVVFLVWTASAGYWPFERNRPA
jgi:basic amino acid/polyamine antiporter, APA family